MGLEWASNFKNINLERFSCRQNLFSVPSSLFIESSYGPKLKYPVERNHGLGWIEPAKSDLPWSPSNFGVPEHIELCKRACDSGRGDRLL